ncbi:MAG: IPTL-CTERM sorting domain-containing protein [Proteobacteria bacterium]|nr:IPTL-CTERM sorting domain-containing protein [Pseudomonadota bacterium]
MTGNSMFSPHIRHLTIRIPACVKRVAQRPSIHRPQGFADTGTAAFPRCGSLARQRAQRLLAAGLCLLLSLQTTQARASYTPNGDGTVTDGATALVWDQQAFGTCTQAATASGPTFNWQTALQAAITANACTYKGHADWRLPNVDELESLVLASTSNPAVDGTAGLDSATSTGAFWTSTAYSPRTTFAWYVSFYNGVVNSGNIQNSFSVRLVRGGPSTATFDSLFVNGACGSDNGGTFAVLDSTDANLCRAGTVSGFTGTGPWNWSCTGSIGGSTASCSAQKQAVALPATPAPTLSEWALILLGVLLAGIGLTCRLLGWMRASRPPRPAIETDMNRPHLIPALAAALAVSALTMACDNAVAQNLEPHFITDPAFNNMPAYKALTPAGWKFQGSVARGCSPPSGWLVETSPDEHFQIVVQPPMTWKWSSTMRMPTAPGCLPMTQAMSAQAFLESYVQGTTNRGPMKILGTMPLADHYRQTAQMIAQQQQTGLNPSLKGTVDIGAIRVQTANGEERLRALLICALSQIYSSCTAQVDVVRAPQGQLDEFTRYVDANGLQSPQTNPAWQQQAMQMQQRLAQQTSNALHQQYLNSSAALTANHNAFMRQFNAQGDARKSAFAAQMRQKDQNRADAVNNILDRQTYTGANGTYNTYNGNASHSWSNPNGGTYGTNDPNANPGGNWTQDTRVHGDGTPYGH